jgi:carotenoid cleavage dioxygenase-like enzyme
LNVLQTVDVTKYFPDVRSTFAHPHVDKDGTWLTCGFIKNGKQNTADFKFIRYKGGEEGAKASNLCEQGEVIATLPSSYSYGFSYYHSFGITEKYLIFLEQSVMLNYKDYLMGLALNKPLSWSLVTYKDLPTRIHVVDKQTGERVEKKFYTDPQFTFHHINAYEDKDEIVVDLSSYDTDYFTMFSYSYENSYSNEFLNHKSIYPVAKRLRVPLSKSPDNKGEIYCELKNLNPDFPFEFPVINYARHNGLPYKYVYGSNHSKLPFSVVKLNMDNPEEFCEKTFENEGGREIPSEPIFVENPDAKSEDDGVLLVLVLSEKSDYLCVLDAKNLNQIARADLPDGVKSAFTFHGFFADSKVFEKLNV